MDQVPDRQGPLKNVISCNGLTSLPLLLEQSFELLYVLLVLMVHDTSESGDEVIQGSTRVDPIDLLQLLGVGKPIQVHKEHLVFLLRPHCSTNLLNLVS
jgi:hypothetical protein